MIPRQTHILGRSGVYDVGLHSPNGSFHLIRVQPLQGGGPGVVRGLDIGQVDFIEQPEHGLVVRGNVVVVLHGQGDAVFGRLLSGQLQSFDHQGILLVKRYAGALVTGKDAYHGRAQVSCQSGQLRHVRHLNLRVGNTDLVNAGREIGVPGQTDQFQTEAFNALLQGLACVCIVIQNRHMGPLGHQHDAVKSELFCLDEECVHTQSGLSSPETRVAHGMETRLDLEVSGVACGRLLRKRGRAC